VKKGRQLRGTYQTACDVKRTGATQKRTLKAFDLLSVPRIKELSSGEIRALRAQARVSQAVFAALLNTSVSTIQKWEIGEKRPSGPSMKLLNVIQRKGLEGVS
jgi:putative transcriptional regulator